MPVDPKQHTPGLESPPSQAVAVTPHDDNDLAWVARSLWIGTGGDVQVLHLDDTAPVTLPDVPSGYELVGLFRRVLADETTASGIVARR